MFRKYILPALAIGGLALAVDTVRTGAKPQKVAQPVAQPATAPYAAYVAGAGIIEALTENVAMGTPVPATVAEMYVSPGDRVKKGQKLFRMDDRDLQADLLVKRANVESAAQRLARLKSLPRPEDVPPAQAKVAESEALLADAQSQLQLLEAVTDRRAVSVDELNRKRNAAKTAEARLNQSEAELALLKAGAWVGDIAVAQADLDAAQAAVKSTQALLDRLTVCSPMDGQVLQVKTRVGEFASQAGSKDPLLLLGNIDELAVRVDVDENDAWRVLPGTRAKAFVRGNGQFQTDLQYVRTEPYIVPKRSLTGDATERVDTRVLQVIYKFDVKQLPVYVGQQMDVFIEAPQGNDVKMHVTIRESR